jgi:hypothetical protein
VSGGDRRNADAALVAALACGGTVEASAKAAGVSVPTVRRRLAEPEFRKAVDEARAEAVSRAVARLSATATLAADTLRELLKAKSEAVRLGASRAVLELGARLREQEELAARVAALEAQLGAGEPPTKGGNRWAN